MAAYVYTILACLAALLYLIYVTLKRRSCSTLPCPKGLPILGNLLQLNCKRPDLLLSTWGKELGPIFRFRLLSRDIVVANSYETIREMLVTKGKDFGGRPFKYGQKIKYLYDYGTSIFANNPCPQWKFLRSTLHSNIKLYDAGLSKVESVNLSVILDLVKDFKKREGKPFNPKESIYNAIMNIICVFIIGRKYKVEDEVFQLFKKVETATIQVTGPGAEGPELDVMWFLRHFGNKTFKKLNQLRRWRDQLWGMVKEDLDARKAQESSLKDNTSRGIIGNLLDTVNEGSAITKARCHVTEKNVMLCFQELVLAGTGTTAHSTCAFLNILINYPKVQRRLQQEVDEVIGDDRFASLSDRTAMPYTRAVIYELLRFTSVVSLALTHAAMKDETLSGHPIAKDTVIIPNLWGLHHDEDFWKEPYVFNPDRFLDVDGQLLPADHPHRKHLMPFGAGTRVCLGESLALGRLFLLVTTFVQMFDIEAGDQKVSADPRTYIRGSILAQPDYEVRMIPRNRKLCL